MAKERIGIMGGTFNPIHTGHIRMALSAKEQAGLDRVLVVPTGNPPHKQHIAPAEDRWKMVCAACAQEEALTPTGWEEEAAALGKRQIPGSVAFVPGAAGLLLAGEVIRDLTGHGRA